MADFLFAARFLRDLAEWEAESSAADREQLDRALAAISRDPELAGRVPSFYDPKRPSYLYRAGPLLIHYRVRDDRTVEFLNLFFRRL
ncbi:MAG: hypothetical protein HYY35_01260 [Deltaproteobacteria bacterium]|nr:hypothetical protein [Deltaproteobacteria bacterium]